MTLSVVIPMFKTAAVLEELLHRLSSVVPHGTEVILVDDECPEQSWRTALSIADTGLDIVVLRLTRNVGQLAAVQTGLSHARGDFVAIMDADLQDSPEALPLLLDTLIASPDVDVVCSVRAGKYESLTRRLTARLYRRVASVMSGGRIPPNAGMFMVARRRVIVDLLALDDPFIPIVPGMARVRATMKGVEVVRQARPVGRSSYSSLGRMAQSARGLVTLSPFHPILARANRARRARIDSHVLVVS